MLLGSFLSKPFKGGKYTNSSSVNYTRNLNPQPKAFQRMLCVFKQNWKG